MFRCSLLVIHFRTYQTYNSECTSFSLELSGNRSANPTTPGVSWCCSFQDVFLVSASRPCTTERLAPSEGSLLGINFRALDMWLKKCPFWSFWAQRFPVSFSQCLPAEMSWHWETWFLQLFPTGHSFWGRRTSDLKCTRGQSLEADSLNRLLAAWKLLPNMSQWVLQTIERGYRIYLGSHPPRFSWVSAIVLKPKQTLNCTLSTYKFRMLTLKLIVSQVRSKDWIIMIDLKDACFHIYIPQNRPSLWSSFTDCCDSWQLHPMWYIWHSAHETFVEVAQDQGVFPEG